MITKTLGRRLKALRARKGLNQEEFALSVGMPRIYYDAIETGTRIASVLELETLAQKLGVTLEELFRGL